MQDTFSQKLPYDKIDYSNKEMINWTFYDNLTERSADLFMAKIGKMKEDWKVIKDSDNNVRNSYFDILNYIIQPCCLVTFYNNVISAQFVTPTHMKHIEEVKKAIKIMIRATDAPLIECIVESELQKKVRNKEVTFRPYNSQEECDVILMYNQCIRFQY